MVGKVIGPMWEATTVVLTNGHGVELLTRRIEAQITAPNFVNGVKMPSAPVDLGLSHHFSWDRASCVNVKVIAILLLYF